MTVEEYIANRSPAIQPLLIQLRRLILDSSPQMYEKISWGIPFFYCKGHVCYLNSPKSGPERVELAFLRGFELSDEAGLLRDQGRKTVKSITFTAGQRFAGQSVDDVRIRQYVQEAVLLNELAPDPPAAFVRRKRMT